MKPLAVTMALFILMAAAHAFAVDQPVTGNYEAGMKLLREAGAPDETLSPKNRQQATEKYYRAFAILKAAADADDPDALMEVGRLYENRPFGNIFDDILEESGIPGLFSRPEPKYRQDVTKAFAYYRKAANLGHITAQFHLCRRYSDGYNVPKDRILAYAWCSLAATKVRLKINFAKYYEREFEREFDQASQTFAKQERNKLEADMTAAEVAKAQRFVRQWRAVPPPPRQGVIRSGSGFFVNTAGYILTNYHVVNGCREIRVSPDTVARYAAANAENDLALLKVAGPPESSAAFRVGNPVRVGEAVVVAGFPLPGLVSSRLNVTIGNVSATAGPSDDERLLQISAPVQPGNSGGPLLDRSGQVVGIVVARLNALEVARLTGQLPENVNYAINVATMLKFLVAHGVSFRSEPSQSRLEPADVAASAGRFVVRVECRN